MLYRIKNYKIAENRDVVCVLFNTNLDVTRQFCEMYLRINYGIFVYIISPNTQL